MPLNQQVLEGEGRIRFGYYMKGSIAYLRHSETDFINGGVASVRVNEEQKLSQGR